jgi:hypothetical protein
MLILEVDLFEIFNIYLHWKTTDEFSKQFGIDLIFQLILSNFSVTQSEVHLEWRERGDMKIICKGDDEIISAHHQINVFFVTAKVVLWNQIFEHVFSKYVLHLPF